MESEFASEDFFLSCSLGYHWQMFLSSQLYRAQNQENGEIPLSESKNTLFHPLLGNHLNGHFRAFNSPLIWEFLYEGGIECPTMAI